MTKIDNSKVFLGGIYTDATVTVPANTTYEEGLVLGRDSSGNLTAFTSENTNSTPVFILAQHIKNDESTAEDFPMARVFDGGAVNKDKLIFAKAADASSASVLDALKINGFDLVTVTEMAV